MADSLAIRSVSPPHVGIIKRLVHRTEADIAVTGAGGVVQVRHVTLFGLSCLTCYTDLIVLQNQGE